MRKDNSVYSKNCKSCFCLENSSAFIEIPTNGSFWCLERVVKIAISVLVERHDAAGNILLCNDSESGGRTGVDTGLEGHPLKVLVRKFIFVVAHKNSLCL